MKEKGGIRGSSTRRGLVECLLRHIQERPQRESESGLGGMEEMGKRSQPPPRPARIEASCRGAPLLREILGERFVENQISRSRSGKRAVRQKSHRGQAKEP